MDCTEDEKLLAQRNILQNASDNWSALVVRAEDFRLLPAKAGNTLLYWLGDERISPVSDKYIEDFEKNAHKYLATKNAPKKVLAGVVQAAKIIAERKGFPSLKWDDETALQWANWHILGYEGSSKTLELLLMKQRISATPSRKRIASHGDFPATPVKKAKSFDLHVPDRIVKRLHNIWKQHEKADEKRSSEEDSKKKEKQDKESDELYKKRVENCDFVVEEASGHLCVSCGSKLKHHLFTKHPWLKGYNCDRCQFGCEECGSNRGVLICPVPSCARVFCRPCSPHSSSYLCQSCETSENRPVVFASIRTDWKFKNKSAWLVNDAQCTVCPKSPGWPSLPFNYGPASGKRLYSMWPPISVARFGDSRIFKRKYHLNGYRYNVASSNNFKVLTKIYKFAAGRTVVSSAVCKVCDTFFSFGRELAVKPKLRVLSLFDGIGTGLLVLEQLGLEVEKYYASEVDSSAIAIVNAHYPGRVTHLGDVAQISHEVLSSLGPINLVIGGSPCNQLSRVNATAKGLLNVEGSGVLFFDFARILRYLKTHSNHHLFWLFENVSSMRKDYRAIISRSLECEAAVWNAADYSPQRRTRLFWGNIPGLYTGMKTEPTPKPLSDVLTPGCYRETDFQIINTITTNSNSQFQGRTAEMPVKVHGEGEKLWITEIERIFGFPTHYTDVGNFSMTCRSELLGRAWSVPVLKKMLKPLSHFFSTKKLKS